MTTNTIDNQTYIEGIKNGDAAVIRSIYENYHQAIIHLVEKNKGNSEDARDVFQEGLMLLFQKVQDPKFNLTSSFLTYFYAVCRNIWSNKLRKKSKSEVTITDQMTLILGEEDLPGIEQNEQYVLYRKKFLQLGEDCQKVLDFFLQKISMKEIMEKMGFGSIAYAKKRKFQCKEQLVKMIKQDPVFVELMY